MARAIANGASTPRMGFELYYREYGRDHHTDGSERIPVLCLPGLTRNSRDFHDFALRLAPQRRVLAMDYRGRGRSARDPDWRNYRPETYISDIFDLLAVADAPKIVAVGTSMGGLLTMGLAAYRPTCLAGAVLNDIGPDVDPEGYRRILAYIGADRPHPDYDAAIADMRELFPSLSFQTEAAWQRLAEGTYRRGDDGLLHFDWDIALARALGASQARYPDLWPMFRGLGKRPVLALARRRVRCAKSGDLRAHGRGEARSAARRDTRCWPCPRSRRKGVDPCPR